MKVLPRADEWVVERVRKVSKTTWIAFFTAVITSIIINFPAYSLRLQTPDAVYGDPFTPWYWDFQLGRFVLALIGYFKHFFNLTYYSCAIAFVFIGLTAVLLCHILQIKSSLMVFIISALMAVFPAYAWMTQLFYYIEAYVASLFFAMFAIWLSNKRYGIITGAVAMCISLGLYQSSIAAAITLALLLIIRQLLAENKNLKMIALSAMRMLVVGVLGGIAYFVIYHAACAWLHIPTAVASYSGIEAILNPANWGPIIKDIYTTAIGFYISPNAYNNGEWGLHILNIIILAVGLVGLLCKIRRAQWWRGALSVVIIVLLPFAMLFLLILSPTHITPWGFMVPLLLPMLFGVSAFIQELEITDKKQILIGMQYVLIIAMLLLCNSYWKYNTANYLAMELTQNKAVSLANRLVSDMEEVDGYTPGMKVMFCGTENPELYPRIHNQIYDYTSAHSADSGMVWADLSCAQMEWTGIMHQFIGISYQQTTVEDFKYIIPTEQYQNMPLYPEQGSIQIINDTMVIKLSSVYDSVTY